MVIEADDKHLISSIVPINYSDVSVIHKINASKATSKPYIDRKSLCKELISDGYSMLEYGIDNDFICGKDFYNDFKDASITDGMNIYTFYTSSVGDGYDYINDNIESINDTLKNNDNANFSVLSVIDYYLMINKQKSLYEPGYTKVDYIYITFDMLTNIQKALLRLKDKNDSISLSYYSNFVNKTCNILLSQNWKGFLLFMKHIKGDDINKILAQAQDVWSQVQQPITPNGGMLNSFVATQAEYNYDVNYDVTRYYSNALWSDNTWNNTSYTYQSNYLKGGDIDDMYI